MAPKVELVSTKTLKENFAPETIIKNTDKIIQSVPLVEKLPSDNVSVKQLQEICPRLRRTRRLPSRFKDNDVLKRYLENNTKRVEYFSECKQTISPPLSPINSAASTKQKTVHETSNNSGETLLMCRQAIFQPLTPLCPNEAQREMEKKLAVYDFTFNPDEEPPHKKASYQIIKKKSVPKPKLYYFNNNYEKNLMNTLQNLKGKLSKAGINDITQGNNENSSFQNETKLPNFSTVFQQPNNLNANYVGNIDNTSSKSSQLQTPIVTYIPNHQENDIFRKESIASSSSKNNSLAKPWRFDTVLQKADLYNERTFKSVQTPFKNSVQTNILHDIVPNDSAKLKQTSIVSFIRHENMSMKNLWTCTSSNITECSVIDKNIEENRTSDKEISEEWTLLQHKTTKKTGITLSEDEIEGIDENQELVALNRIDSEHVTGNGHTPEIVHHLKANRKSYGKAKNLTSRQ